MTPRRILATGLGAMLLLYVLVAALLVVNSDTDSASADTQRFAVGQIEVTLDGARVQLAGVAPSDPFVADLVDSIAARTDVTVVIDQLVIDPTATLPAIETFHTGIDALRSGSE